MPEHLRALVVVFTLGFGLFHATRAAVLPLVSGDTFGRWRNLWLLSTLVLFLSHNIWVCIALLVGLLLAYRRREAHVMGLYFVVLFVAPPAPVVIPGFGILDHFWVLDHYRLLGLTLLLPTAISLFQRSSTPRLGSSPVDWMVLGYACLLSMLAFRDGNVTSAMRAAFSVWIDIFLPYYVASRSIRSMEGLRHALTGYVLAAMILALVGIFEVLRTWKIYPSALVALGLSEDPFRSYLMRSGLLRPNATVGDSIVLGYVLVVGLGFFLYLKDFVIKPLNRWLGMGLLIAGIVASLSRGPWVGGFFLVIAFIIMGPRPVRQLVRLVLAGAVVLLALDQLPSGQRLIDMLPVIGSIEQENVEYRADLLTTALPVIGRSLLFGSGDFLDAPELQVMIQGDGIIDVVNSYVGVALHAGLAGLVFFAGAFLLALLQLRRGARIARRCDPGAAVLGRALLATLASIMLIIYTVSSISVIPVVYWSMLGLCVAYALAMKEMGHKPNKVSGS